MPVSLLRMPSRNVGMYPLDFLVSLLLEKSLLKISTLKIFLSILEFYVATFKKRRISTRRKKVDMAHSRSYSKIQINLFKQLIMEDN